MRIAIIAFTLVVALGATQNTTSGGLHDQLGGCKLRCRKLRFIGEGSVPVKPSWALLDLSVEVSSLQLKGDTGSSNISGGSGGNQSAAAKQVREEAHHRAAFILNYLKDLKMEDIKNLETQEISFRPEYTMEDGERKFVGYKATFGLSFKVAIDKFQEVLDSIVSESGANRVNSIVFVADEQDEKQANIKAIELATQDAWQQAQAVAKVFGLQGNLKLLSVRDKLRPLKRLIRRFAQRLSDNDDMMGDNDDDNDDTSMLNLMKGDSIVNARLVFKFDFEDGTINFQDVQPIENNMTVADTFGGLLKEGQDKPQETKAQQPGETQTVQPVATNATALPNSTVAGQPAATNGPQPTPATTVP